MSQPPNKVTKPSSDCDTASYSIGTSFSSPFSVSSVRSESLSVRSRSPSRNVAGPSVSLRVGSTIHLSYESNVILTSNVVLHKKHYTCSTFERTDGQSLVAFIDNEFPEANHVCDRPSNNEHTYAVIDRKPKSATINLTVTYCILQGTLSGNEIYVSSLNTYFSPLKFIEGETRLPTKGKLYCCCYCFKIRAEISNHILRQHKMEPAVLDIAALAPNSKERNNRLKELRLQGDAHYNKQVPMETRIPIRKPTVTNLQDCITCLNCKGMIAPKNFARHERHCANRTSNYKRVAVEERRAEQEVKPANEMLTERLLDDLLEPIKDDEIGQPPDSECSTRHELYSMLHPTPNSISRSCDSKVMSCILSS